MSEQKTDADERVDLTKWRARRQNESAARKPRNKAKYYRPRKHRKQDQE